MCVLCVCCVCVCLCVFFFFQAEDGIRDLVRSRGLGDVYKRQVYVYLDARYEKVRQDGCVADAAVLVAAGVDKEGRRQLLGVSVALSEQEVHWLSLIHI